jgi:hypothetical protein
MLILYGLILVDIVPLLLAITDKPSALSLVVAHFVHKDSHVNLTLD